MTVPANAKCKTCRWWYERTKVGPDRQHGVGPCKRHPPQVIFWDGAHTSFPEVYESDICGDWTTNPVKRKKVKR